MAACDHSVGAVVGVGGVYSAACFSRKVSHPIVGVGPLTTPYQAARSVIGTLHSAPAVDKPGPVPRAVIRILLSQSLGRVSPGFIERGVGVTVDRSADADV